MRMPARLKSVAATVTLLAALLGIAGAVPALAAVPALKVNVFRSPASLPPGGEGMLTLEVVNLGDAPAAGEVTPITILDRLPAGLTATGISEEGAGCTLETPESVRCEYHAGVPPYGRIRAATLTVKASGNAAPTLINETSVAGGGAAVTHAREALPVSATPAGFDVEKLQLQATNEDGSLDTQAGSHPFQVTSTVNMSTDNVKDLRFDLPPGLIGNPQVIPQCTSKQFETLLEDNFNACHPETAIGVAMVLEGNGSFRVPLFNLVPSRGEPARFGFSVEGVPVTLGTAVRTGGDYGVVVSADNISQDLPITGSQVTFWGVPGDPSHDSVRGWDCLYNDFGEYNELGEIFPCPAHEPLKQTPFLTLPTSCSGPAGMRTAMEGDSWLQPGVFEYGGYTPQNGVGEAIGLNGCNGERFAPSIDVAPDGLEASTPTGLTVDVHQSQGGALNPTGLAPADVKDITVALPEGVALNPAGADGLQACSEGLIGYLPESSSAQARLFSPGEQSCPDASKIGEATIKTPLLPNPLKGAVYLASQNENPFGSLVAMYIVAKDPVSGVLVKLPGEVSLNGDTGQITATFKNNPQLPFEDAELHFYGGARAPLASPAHCGTYTTQASFTPWSGTEAVSGSSYFDITSGPNHGACPGASLPFAPTLASGSPNINAGAFSALTTTITREDGNQNISSVQLHYPPGLSGLLSGVKLCGEAEANAGTCGPESQIGETIVSVGLGGDPFSVTGGKVYITGPYRGAPFGLSIVNPAKAGPFDLGKVIVRAKIEVDPHTAALTITTDSEGPYKIPTIIDGIPLQIKHVNVVVNRPGFTFNPTNCTPMQVTGRINSAEGASAPVSVPFQVTNCAALKFAPKFAVSTSGKTSRAKGASLNVKLTYPNAPFGSQANIARVKVDLPKQLPSRLTTLQKACTAAQFELNPANCPKASFIGHAKAITPLLPVPLEGPAIFVSHGGEAFPSLIVVLQGYGVTLDLVGTTFISKTGITSSTFKTVPDAPVGSFELNLPEGKYSALAANGNLCKSRLKMPTEFVAQNGAKINESTPIAVTGCKPAITVTSHKVKGKTATIKVRVPSAGKLVATGKGLSKATKTSKGATTLTLKLTLNKKEVAFLKKHHAKRLKARIHLTFTTKSASKLTTSTTVYIG
ncbi:MAG TPA: hypothetical protein VIJ66_00330 [Solirubrobacteraceae bacterium]